MALPTVPEEEARKIFPKGAFTKELLFGKKYLHYTSHSGLSEELVLELLT